MSDSPNRRLLQLPTRSCLALAGLIAVWSVGAEVSPTVQAKAVAFDLRDVKLLASPFKDAMELNAKYLLSLDPDRLLSGVLRNAGLTPKAPRYGGWESEGVAGQSLGHYMTALALQYRATGDKRFLDRENYIVAELAACQTRDTNGFVAAIPNGRVLFTALKERRGRMEGWVPWYTMHKLFAGLRDAYVLCGNEQARAVLVKLADWADSVTRNLTPEEMETMLGTEHGGMPEVLADVYALTGDPKYLALSKRFCHRFVMDPLSRGEDRLNGLHANTQIPKITGAARLYELTGEDYFHNLADNFWNFVVTNRTYVIGGNSDSEHFFPPEEFHRHLSTATCETCNTYNMLKLTEHLFAWQPAARLLDYYERALYNQILGSQDPRTGMFTYFQSLRPGGFKLYSNPTNAFWCCVGTGMENHTKYGEMIYAHSAEALWVNLFIPSELNWAAKGVQVRQETKFPEGDATKLTFKCKQSTQFALKLREPAWASAFVVLINGAPLKIGGATQGYVSIEQEWRDGDTVEVRFPMSLYTEPLPHSADMLAVLYGPIVLAAQLGDEGLDQLELYQTNHNENIYRNVPVPVVPYFVAEGRRVLERIEPVTGQSLTFKTTGLVQPHDVTLIPHWRTHHQRFAAYFETFTPEEWKPKQQDLAAAEAARRAFEARIVDDVKPGEQQSEVNHAFKGERSNSGGSSPKWRDARDGWFEYTVKVLPESPMELLLTFWGSDGGEREFDLLAGGRVFATEKLNASRPNEIFDKSYSIPTEFTRGKTQIVLRFQAKPGNTAGGIFGVRVLKQSPPATAQSVTNSFNNPVYTNYLADPFCWYHDGMYYAVGTRGGGKHDPARDVPMIKSKDLQHWEYVGEVLDMPTDERGGAVWAPETAYHNGTFYLYYHANGNGKGFRIRVATSKTPEGPYRDTGTPLTDVTQNDFVIDSSAFRDDDGQWYLFYATDFTNTDATTFRGTALAVDRLIDMTRLEGKPTTVMRAHWQWQVYERNRNMRGKVADWFTLEAPEVVKRNGKYYCFYSGGNYQNDSYGVDYLVANDIRGPWTEMGCERGPQIVRSIPGQVFGPGHNSIVRSPAGQDYFVYHAWNPERTKRQVWVDPLFWSNGVPRVERFQARIHEMNQKAAAK